MLNKKNSLVIKDIMTISLEELKEWGENPLYFYNVIVKGVSITGLFITAEEADYGYLINTDNFGEEVVMLSKEGIL